MKDLSLEDKNAIRDALSAYCDNYLSRNRAAESLNGCLLYTSPSPRD